MQSHILWLHSRLNHVSLSADMPGRLQGIICQWNQDLHKLIDLDGRLPVSLGLKMLANTSAPITNAIRNREQKRHATERAKDHFYSNLINTKSISLPSLGNRHYSVTKSSSSCFTQQLTLKMSSVCVFQAQLHHPVWKRQPKHLWVSTTSTQMPVHLVWSCSRHTSPWLSHLLWLLGCITYLSG